MSILVWTFALALCGGSAAFAQTAVPMELSDNRPFVTVVVDGMPMRFVVDTGGGTIIVPSAAKRLGITFNWNGSTTGAGEGSDRTGTATLKSLCVASICSKNVPATVLDLTTIAHKTGMGQVDGLIGAEFLADHVVTFAYGRRQLIIDAPALATGTPMTFYGTIPKVGASVDGIQGSFIVDTGDRSSLTLFPAFARAHDFASKAVRKSVITGMGVGGPIHSDLFVANTISIGTAHRTSLVSRISLAKSGGFSASDVDGSIGSGFLRYFDVTFDYKHKLMQLVPNGARYTDDCNVATDVIAPQPCLLKQ